MPKMIDLRFICPQANSDYAKPFQRASLWAVPLSDCQLTTMVKADVILIAINDPVYVESANEDYSQPKGI